MSRAGKRRKEEQSHLRVRDSNVGNVLIKELRFVSAAEVLRAIHPSILRSDVSEPRRKNKKKCEKDVERGNYVQQRSER